MPASTKKSRVRKSRKPAPSQRQEVRIYFDHDADGEPTLEFVADSYSLGQAVVVAIADAAGYEVEFVSRGTVEV